MKKSMLALACLIAAPCIAFATPPDVGAHGGAGLAQVAPPEGGPGQSGPDFHRQAPSPEEFARFKAMVIARDTAHLTAVETHRACVEHANQPEDMRACADQFHETMRFEQHRPGSAFGHGGLGAEGGERPPAPPRG